MKNFTPLLFVLIFQSALPAQDTLPDFTVRNTGNNRIVVSWVNTYKNIRQISIQRSLDSLTNYKTILTVPDPTTPENGYMDTKALNDHMFYRIYIMLEKGIFFFSPVKKPFFDSIAARKKIILDGKADKIDNPADSLKSLNRALNGKDIVNVFTPSKYIFSLPDGYVRINLPDANKKYNIRFFDEKDKPVFEIKEVKAGSFKIDKSNFYHTGWFKFELYEDGKLVEKHKFFIPKEF